MAGVAVVVICYVISVCICVVDVVGMYIADDVAVVDVVGWHRRW